MVRNVKITQQKSLRVRAISVKSYRRIYLFLSPICHGTDLLSYDNFLLITSSALLDLSELRSTYKKQMFCSLLRAIVIKPALAEKDWSESKYQLYCINHCLITQSQMVEDFQRKYSSNVKKTTAKLLQHTYFPTK